MPKRRPRKEVWSLNPRFLGNKLKPTCVKNCIIQEPRSGGLAQKSLQSPKSKLSLCFDSNSSILAMPPELRRKIKKEESPSPGCEEDVKKGRGRPRKNLENVGGGNNSCDDEGEGKRKFKKLVKSKKSTVSNPSPKKVNKVKTSKSTNKTNNNRKKTGCKSISNISHDDELEMEEIAIREEEFEKRFQNDLNFVLAKFVVRRKVGFNIDRNKNLTGFRRRMQQVIEQADIMKLKSALDAVSGGDGNQRQQVSVPKHFSLPGSDPAAGVKKPQIAGKVKEESVTPRSSSPIRLSNENSPDISISGDNEAKVEEDEDNMPVLMTSTPEAQDPAIKDEPAEAQNLIIETQPQRSKKSSASRKNLLASKFFSSQKKSQPKPLPMFKPLTKSMKIPKQSKSKVPKWIKNGDLWKWALNVDENGEYSW